MGLSDIVRNGVALAKSITADLQTEVQIEPWIAATTSGGPTYGAARTFRAIVDYKQRLRRTVPGQEVLQQAAVYILEPVSANGATGRNEPIDSRDKVTLPSGFTGPILDVMGVVDPSTEAPYLYEIVLGAKATL